MLLFRRIFNFEKPQVARIEKRLNQRYAPGAAFPLSAVLTAGGQDWPARVQDLGVHGAALTIAAGAEPPSGLAVAVRLTLGKHQLEIPAELLHARRQASGEYVCGLRFNFPDYPVQKAYLQLLQPVVIGQSLKAVSADRIAQNEPQLTKLVFRDGAESVLMAWLENKSGTPVDNFEFQMQGYCCRANAQAGQLEVYLREPDDSPVGQSSSLAAEGAGDLQAEIRQLFRWIVPNLSSEVPGNVQVFLQRFAR